MKKWAAIDSSQSLNLFEEISNELADISNYAFLQYIKIMKLEEKTKSIEITRKPERAD